MKKTIILTFVFALLCVGLVSALSTDNLVAYYNFSSDANDSSGNGLNGVFMNGADNNASGKMNNASWFGGVDEFVNVTDNFISRFSISNIIW